MNDQTTATATGSPAEWADVARRKYDHYKALCDAYEAGGENTPTDIAITTAERNCAELVPHLVNAIDQVRDDRTFHANRCLAVEKVLDGALGTDAEDGAGEGLAADVALVVQQRDEARAAVERMRGQLEAIQALHTESPAGFCPSCYRANDVSDTDDGLVAWPCPTLQAMGITAGALSR